MGTGLRYFFTVLIGMTVSMVLAFTTVRLLTRGTTYVGDLSPQERDRAWALRETANEMARLIHAFQEAVPARSAPPAPGTLRWLREELPGRIQALDARLATPSLVDLPEAKALRAAGERLKTLGLHPQDPALRSAALGEIRGALDDIDQYLNAPQRHGRIALPAPPPR